MAPCNSKVGTCVDRDFPLRSAADLNSTFCFLPRTVTQPMTRASKAHAHAQKLSRGGTSEDEKRDRECPQAACERGRVRRERHTAGESRVPPRDLNAPTDRIADSSTVELAIDTPETGCPTSSRRGAETRVRVTRTGGSRIGPRRSHVGRRFFERHCARDDVLDLTRLVEGGDAAAARLSGLFSVLNHARGERVSRKPVDRSWIGHLPPGRTCSTDEAHGARSAAALKTPQEVSNACALKFVTF